jgi:DNA-binding NarL/FixJ family response regulator
MTPAIECFMLIGEREHRLACEETTVAHDVQAPLRLLLVEGHDAVRDALLGRLARLSMVSAAAAANTLPVALAFLREFRPDVVLCDPRTLKGNPGEIIGRLAEAPCPIVVLTSLLWDEEEILCLKAGATTVALKGTDLGALLANLTPPKGRAGRHYQRR